MRPYRFFEITPRSWHEAKLIGDIFAGEHIFRGHADSNWKLETTLRRSIQPSSFGDDRIRIRERQIIKKFKSRAFQYIQSPPKDNEYVE